MVAGLGDRADPEPGLRDAHVEGAVVNGEPRLAGDRGAAAELPGPDGIGRDGVRPCPEEDDDRQEADEEEGAAMEGNSDQTYLTRMSGGGKSELCGSRDEARVAFTWRFVREAGRASPVRASRSREPGPPG
jgi:hypothetical protein